MPSVLACTTTGTSFRQDATFCAAACVQHAGASGWVQQLAHAAAYACLCVWYYNRLRLRI
eukprot:363097-Chlamydomonas_euryale.AAC.9